MYVSMCAESNGMPLSSVQHQEGKNEGKYPVERW